MEKIPSFTVDHTKLRSGLYVSRKDIRGDVTVTTLDMRITEPNREPVVDMPALHTIEHLGATFLRNSKYKEDVVYFGPMGCRTGCYIALFGDISAEEAYPMVLEMLDFIISFEGEIPGAKPGECGNWLEQNLGMAKHYIREYRERLTKYRRFKYPE
ncbi:MAG: S-ribosylhomocysteine lyase [Clostridia bacterium]|nr:S-ribosylhomocysteine lyase [Clostridia bacterium]